MDNKQKKLAFLGILLLGCLLTSAASDWAQGHKEPQAPALPPSYADREIKQTTIKIYVSGAVLQPGLYDLPVGARAWQAVEAAGGLREDANVEKVNLAKKLKDGNQVNVPALKAATVRNSSGYVADGAAQSSGQQSAAGKINLNRATAEELGRLPGIGPAMAQRIVERRKTRRFVKVEDLLQVKGIGKAKLERLRYLVEVD